MTFYDDLTAAMTTRLRALADVLYFDVQIADDERVVMYVEDEGYGGYCETCVYEYNFIRYTVENSVGERRDVEEQNVDLAALLRDLEKYSS